MAKESNKSHAVMPSSLAKALIEHGVKHYDFGGDVFGGSGLGGVANALGAVGLGGFGLLGQQLTGNNNANILGMGGSDFNVTVPTVTMQPGLAPEIQNAQARQLQTYLQQQDLANALLQQSQGNGPGQKLLANQAGQDASRQAALMASQRGASANAGLVGRQAAMQGAQAQQQGLNAQAALQLQSQQALAQQQQAMQQANLQSQNINQGSLAAQNSANIQAHLGAQGINSSVANTNTQSRNGILGGLLQGGAAGIAMAALNKGGEVPKKMADGGLMSLPQYATPPTSPVNPYGVGGGQKSGGMDFSSLLMAKGVEKGISDSSISPMGADSSYNDTGYGLANPRSDGMNAGMHMYSDEARTGGGRFEYYQSGGDVPGEPKVDGDSEKNDVVPALLSPGEIVLPRSVTQGGDLEKKAVEFLRHLRGKKGYDKIVDARHTRKLCNGGRMK